MPKKVRNGAVEALEIDEMMENVAEDAHFCDLGRFFDSARCIGTLHADYYPQCAAAPSSFHALSLPKYIFLLFLCIISTCNITHAASQQSLYLSCNPNHNPIDDKYCGLTRDRPCATFLFMMNRVIPLYLKTEEDLEVVVMEENCAYNITCGETFEPLGADTDTTHDFTPLAEDFYSTYTSPVHIGDIQRFAIRGNGLTLNLLGLYRNVPAPHAAPKHPFSYPARPHSTYFSFNNIQDLLLDSISISMDRMGNETSVLSFRNIKSLQVNNFNMKGMLKVDEEKPSERFRSRTLELPMHVIDIFSVGQFWLQNASLYRFYNRFDTVMRVSTTQYVELNSVIFTDITKPFQESGSEGLDQTFLVFFEFPDLFHSFRIVDSGFSDISLQNGFLFLPTSNSSQLSPRGNIVIDSCKFDDVQTSPFLEFYTTGMELTRSTFYRNGREQNGLITSGVARHLVMDDNIFFATTGNIYSSNGVKLTVRINNPKLAIVKNSIFARNVFHYMILSTHSINFEDCTFTQNQNAALNSSLYAGSIFFLFARDDTLYIKADFKRCRFYNNRAVESGAIQGVNNVNISVYDSHFYKNYGVRGGAIRIDNNHHYHSMLYLYNTTFEENMSETHSGAVSCEEGGAVYLYNDTRFLANYKANDLAQIDCDKCRVGGDNPQHLCVGNEDQEWFLLYVGLGVAGGAVFCVSLSLCLLFALGYWCNRAFGQQEKKNKHIVHEIFAVDDERSPDAENPPALVPGANSSILGGAMSSSDESISLRHHIESNPLLPSPLQIQQR